MYRVTVEWSGYSRGTATYLVDAETEQDARENYREYDSVTKQTVRDDTEGEVSSVEEVE